MSWEAVGAIGEVLAAIAVVVTLIYLSFQIRNNTAMTRASIRETRADWHMHNADVFSNSEFLPDIALKAERGEKLTDIEVRRWVAYSQAWHRSSESSLLQAAEGLLDEGVLDGMKNSYRRLIVTNNALMMDWERRRKSLDPQYVDFVDAIRAEESAND